MRSVLFFLGCLMSTAFLQGTPQANVPENYNGTHCPCGCGCKAGCHCGCLEGHPCRCHQK